MKRVITLIAATITLSGCGGFDATTTYTAPAPTPSVTPTPTPTTTPTPSPSPTPTVSAEQVQINALVAANNALRDAQGQEPLTQGLDCNLYTVPTTTTKIVGATLTGIGSFEYNGTFNVPNGAVTLGLSILPAPLRPIYQTWIVLKCTGVLVNTDDAWHSFTTTSDDGSMLYVDGLVVSNDGLHAATTVTNAKFLSAGIHSFELDFFQGGGLQQLQVKKDNSILPAIELYH